MHTPPVLLILRGTKRAGLPYGCIAGTPAQRTEKSFFVSPQFASKTCDDKNTMKPSRIILALGGLFLVALSFFDFIPSVSLPHLRSREIQGGLQHRKLVVPTYAASKNRGTVADIREQDAYLDSIRGMKYIQPRQPLYGIHDNRNPKQIIYGDRYHDKSIPRMQKRYSGVHDKSGHLAEGFRK